MIAVGATTIIHRVFDAAQVVDEIERSRVTCMWTAPAMVRGDPRRARHRGARPLVGPGDHRRRREDADPVHRAAARARSRRRGSPTRTASPRRCRATRSSTATSTVSKLGSVGRPCQYLELDIWDEHGASVPPGERGEVVLRGPKVFKGYWRDPDATSRGVRRRLVPHRRHRRARRRRLPLHRRPAQGHDRVGRREHRQLRGRAGALRARRRSSRPRSSAAPTSGGARCRSPTSCSSATARPTTPDELIEHCRGQLAKFKVPKDVTFIDALPRNPSGKVLKRELRSPTGLTAGATGTSADQSMQVGGHVVAGLVVDRRPSARRRPRSSASPSAWT